MTEKYDLTSNLVLKKPPSACFQFQKFGIQRMILKTIMFFRTNSISFFLLFFSILLCFTQTTAHQCAATCTVNNGTIQGVVRFSNVNNQIKIDVVLSGLAPNKKMGFHIHEGSDLSEGCTKAGGHYNPLGKNHSCPGTSGDNIHYGDLGNIESNAAGQVTTTIWLAGSTTAPYPIINRAIVIHENTDDCGLGGFSDSLINGHAGKRIACCLIKANSGSGSGGGGSGSVGGGGGGSGGGGTGGGGGSGSGGGGGGIIGIQIGPIRI